MGIILDIIVIAIIVITALISAKKGFVRTLIELAGFIASLIIVFTVSTPAAEFIYDRAVEPPMLSSVEKGIEEKGETPVGTVLLSVPKFIAKGVEKLGVSSDKLSVDVAGDALEAAKTTSQTVIKPAVTNILSFLISVLLLIILLFIVGIVAKAVNKLFSFSIVGKLNRTLGGVIGIVKGAIIAFVFCSLIGLILLFTTGGFLIFTPEAVASSYVFKAISEFNPLILFS